MAELLLDSEDIQEEIEVGTEPPPKKRRRLRNKEAVALCRRLSSIESSEPPLPNSRSKAMRGPVKQKSVLVKIGPGDRNLQQKNSPPGPLFAAKKRSYIAKYGPTL